MTDTHHQSASSPSLPSSPVTSSDAGLTDAEVRVGLAADVAAFHEVADPKQSIWAQIGTPADVQFGAAASNVTRASGGYQVSPDRLQDWINRLQSVADQMTVDLRKVTTIQNVTSPAPDGGSTMSVSA